MTKKPEPKLRASQARVLNMFKLYGDLHDQALITYLHDLEKSAGMKLMSPSGARTRRAELVAKGLVQAKRTEVVDGRTVAVWGLR